MKNVPSPSTVIALPSMRQMIIVTALSAAACFKLPVPTTLQGSAKPTYSGKCPVHFEPLTTAQMEAEGKPYTAWTAPDDALKREMAEVPDEFNRMSKNCDALTGAPAARLTVKVRKAAFVPHQPSTFTFEVTDGTGAVVHAFEYGSQVNWNPFIQARLQANNLCSFIQAACDDKLE